jgi:hypothetical protein
MISTSNVNPYLQENTGCYMSYAPFTPPCFRLPPRTPSASLRPATDGPPRGPSRPLRRRLPGRVAGQQPAGRTPALGAMRGSEAEMSPQYPAAERPLRAPPLDGSRSLIATEPVGGTSIDVLASPPTIRSPMGEGSGQVGYGGRGKERRSSSGCESVVHVEGGGGSGERERKARSGRIWWSRRGRRTVFAWRNRAFRREGPFHRPGAPHAL